MHRIRAIVIVAGSLAATRAAGYCDSETVAEAYCPAIVTYGEIRSVRRPALGCAPTRYDDLHLRMDVTECFGWACESGGLVGEVDWWLSDAGLCGVELTEGEPWLIYLQSGRHYGYLSTRSRPMEADDPELDELAALSALDREIACP